MRPCLRVCDRGSAMSVGANKLEGSIPDLYAWGLTKLQCVRLLRVSCVMESGPIDSSAVLHAL
jgi:hypothetical protein